jgi:hypothetical protein
MTDYAQQLPPPTQGGRSAQSDYRKALRVANIIATFKMLVLVAILGVSVIGFVVGLMSGEGSGILSGLLFLVVGVIGAAIYYVLFGWFEHTLRVLVAIADHTSGRV